MNINRHNYEEFFLLYVDNELTAEQKKSVMQFVQDNPDLAGELELFRQTSLASDEEIVFEGKELLFKQENDSLITMSNYEEWMVAYIDNELTAPEMAAFENFMASHPAVAEVFPVFMQTKLQPETEIVFANKEILYRKEEKVRVISMSWWKVAVAAAIILAIGITTFTVVTRQTTVPADVAGRNGQQTAPGNNTAAVPKKNNTAAGEEKTTQQQPAPEVNKKNEAVALTPSPKDKQTVLPEQKITPEKVNKKQLIAPATIASNSVANTKTKTAPVRATIDSNNTPTRNVAVAVPIVRHTDSVNNNTIAVNNKPVKENINNQAVTNVPDKPYNTIETAPEKDIEPVFVSNNESSNKKTRGFFRKATRIFEKRTNISAADDDDKVLIGVLAVRLK